jgi:hypothetical protein
MDICCFSDYASTEARKTMGLYAVDRETLVASIRPARRVRILLWMYQACEDLFLTRDACHTAVNLFDRFVSGRRVMCGDLHLLATTCIYIAAKVCDNGDEAIRADDLRETTAGAIRHNHEIIDAELVVLHALGFFVTPRSAPTFLDTSRADYSDAAYRLDVATLDPRYADHTPEDLARFVSSAEAGLPAKDCPQWLLGYTKHETPPESKGMDVDVRVKSTIQTAHANSEEGDDIVKFYSAARARQ